MAKTKSRDITRADAQALTKTTTERGSAREGHAQKTERMGRAIANAIVARGSVTQQDIQQAGFTTAERETYYNDAFAYAQTLDPAIADAALL